jgi:hypothetical protein
VVSDVKTEAPLPEFAEFVAPFTVQFVQRPSARVLERYCSGLLTEHPNKNGDTLADVEFATWKNMQVRFLG